jgi:hypothetical protein
MKIEEAKVISMLFCITARIWSFVYPKRITQTLEHAALLYIAISIWLSTDCDILKNIFVSTFATITVFVTGSVHHPAMTSFRPRAGDLQRLSIAMPITNLLTIDGGLRI